MPFQVMWIMGDTARASYIGKRTLASASALNRISRRVVMSLLAIVMTLDETRPFNIVSRLSFITGISESNLLVCHLQRNGSSIDSEYRTNFPLIT
jgi:hypothetical protein